MDKQNRPSMERWYPLTYPGGYTESLTVEATAEHEHCVLDVAAFRGHTLGLHLRCSGNFCCALTDDDGALLSTWQTMPGTLTVPETARRLYLTSDHTACPDFYLTVPAGVRPAPNGLLFSADFTGFLTPDPNNFTDPLPPVGADGLVLPHGIEHALVVNRSTATDSWTLSAEFTAPAHDETVFLGTRITQINNCRHASLCSVDFAAGKLRLYRGSTGAELPEEVVEEADISSLLTGRNGIRQHDFTLRMERVNVAIRAVLMSRTTGEEVSVFRGLTQLETETTIAGSCAAGKMYDSPQLFVTTGKPVILRLYAAAKTTPKVMFFGDSLTQGAHNLPEDGWAQMSAAYFGDSMCCGRGSGDIWSCLNQVRSLVPVCRPKAMVVTIGTNNKAHITASLYEKLVHMASYWGVTLIVNCPPACDKRPPVKAMNQIICSLPVPGCRFDLATRRDNDPEQKADFRLFAADQTHLNGDGNRVLFERFTREFGWLKDL